MSTVNNLYVNEVIYSANGTVSAPSYTFANDTNTGIYSSGADSVDIATGGVQRSNIDSNGTVNIFRTTNQLTLGDTKTTTISATAPGTSSTYTIPDVGTTADFVFTAGAQTLSGQKTLADPITTGQVRSAVGTAALPSYTFSGDLDTGIYSSGANSVDIATAGAQQVNVSSAGVRVNTLGSVTAPAYSFIGDTNTGIYSAAADSLDIATGGVRRVNVNSTGNVFVFATTNQLVLGTGNTTAISATAPTGSRTYTIPDVGGAADFVMTAGAQTLSGQKTLADPITTGQVRSAVGTAAAPAYSFTGDTNTGIYSSTADNVDIATAGVNRVNVNANGVTVATGQNILPLGTVGAPSYTFTGDLNTGIYSSGADVVDIAVGGANKVRVNATGLTVSVGGQAFVPQGSAAAPTYTFSGFGDTGLYTAGDNSVRVTNGGVQSVNVSATGVLNVLRTTDQLTLGTTNTTTISATAPAASRTYTIPDVLGAADFVMTAGTQTLTGTKTLTNQSWTTTGITTPGVGTYSCVASSGQVAVAVANGGLTNRIATTTTGLTWSAVTTLDAIPMTSVCYGEVSPTPLFVTVGSGGTVHYATVSGTTVGSWTAATAPVARAWQSVAYLPLGSSRGVFCAVANNAGPTDTVMYSVLGTGTWTSGTIGTNTWISICASPQLGIFVAISPVASTNTVTTSTNGATWVSRTTPNTGTPNWKSVCWSPERNLFVAVASNSAGGVRVMTSPDGITWTLNTANAGVDAISWNSVYWQSSPARFCAVASGSTMFSPDGFNWTIVTQTGTWVSVCPFSQSGQKLIAVSSTASTSGAMVNTVISSNSTNMATNSIVEATTGSGVVVERVSHNDGVLSYPPTTTKQRNSGVSDPGSTVYNSDSKTLEVYDGAGWNQLPKKKDIHISINQYADTNWVGGVVASNDWASVCWSSELGLFCAVAGTGTNRIMTSVDGITWSVVSFDSSAWWSVCWSPELGLFCATALSGTNRIATSPDGVTWTIRTPPSTAAWVSVCWSSELGLFCAVAHNTFVSFRAMTSPDGINWTGRVVPLTGNSWRGVCWSPDLGLFCAVAESGTANTFAMTSPDGTTWTTRTTPASVTVPIAVCWSPELNLFCSVSIGGTDRIMTSPDGITWSAVSSSDDTVGWSSVCWARELGVFVAVGYDGTAANRVMSSYDGLNWVGKQSASDSNSWLCICWSPDLKKFAAVSVTGTNRVMTSSGSDLKVNNLDVSGELTASNTIWTPNPSATVTSAVSYTAVAWNSNLAVFVAVASNGVVADQVMTSPDGITWTKRTSATASTWSSVCCGGIYNVAVSSTASTSAAMINSVLTTTWTSATTPNLGSQTWESVAYSKELDLFVAVADSGTLRTMSISGTGPGGVWVAAAASDDASGWQSVCSADSLGFYAVASSGTNRVMRSTNGTTWSNQTAAAATTWRSVCYSPKLGLVCAVSSTPSTSAVMTTDVSTWTLRTTPNDGSPTWSSITWDASTERFVAVANGGTGIRLMTSTDGIVWIGGNVPNGAWTGVTYSPIGSTSTGSTGIGRLVAVSSLTTTYQTMTLKPGIRTELVNMSNGAITANSGYFTGPVVSLTRPTTRTHIYNTAANVLNISASTAVTAAGPVFPVGVINNAIASGGGYGGLFIIGGLNTERFSLRYTNTESYKQTIETTWCFSTLCATNNVGYIVMLPSDIAVGSPPTAVTGSASYTAGITALYPKIFIRQPTTATQGTTLTGIYDVPAGYGIRIELQLLVSANLSITVQNITINAKVID